MHAFLVCKQCTQTYVLYMCCDSNFVSSLWCIVKEIEKAVWYGNKMCMCEVEFYKNWIELSVQCIEQGWSFLMTDLFWVQQCLPPSLFNLLITTADLGRQ